MGTRPGALDPGVVLHLFQNLGMSAEGRRDAALQEIGAARHLGHQQRHAPPRWTRRSLRAAGGRLLRLSRRQEIGGPRGRARRRRRPRVHGGHRRELARKSAAASARRPPGSASKWITRRNARTRTAHLALVGACPHHVIPTNEELMIARHTGVLCWDSSTHAPERPGLEKDRHRHGQHHSAGKKKETANPGLGGIPVPVSGSGTSTSATSSSRTTRSITGDEAFLAPATSRTQRDLGHAPGAVRRRAAQRGARRVADSQARSRRTRLATSIATGKSSSASRPTRR